MSDKAVLLLSGGLDSTTCLALSQQRGYEIYALSFSYGQRHSAELAAATRIAEQAKVVAHRIIPIDLGGFGGSALTDRDVNVPESPTEGIPVTYVPARNTVFLSIALAWAEVIGAQHIIAGVNAVDYSGYPDCRPEYIAAFQRMADLATKAGIEGEGPQLWTPLIDMTKSEIINNGIELGVDYAQSVSCYQADEQGRACGRCDSCRIRQEAFIQAGVEDPTRYQ